MYPNQNAMIPNNPFGYNGQLQYGMGVPQQPKPKYTQPLTPEIISKLRSNGDSFEIKVTQEDLWRACCTHKENGAATLVHVGVSPSGNDILRCTICGEEFELIDIAPNKAEEVITEKVNDILNILQSTKTMYLDIPAELAQQFFQMIPLLKKIGPLYNRAVNNFNMYENALGMNPTTNVMGNNGFQMMGAMLSNPYAAFNGYGMQQPMAPQAPFGQPAPMYQQPMAPQAPWGYGQPAPVMGNPIMYGTPAPAPAPQAPAAGTVPPAPPATNGDEVSQQKQFNV